LRGHGFESRTGESKQKPVETVSRTIKGHIVRIEVLRTRSGYRGRWFCDSQGTSGASGTIQTSIEKAIQVNEINAFGGIHN
jgi:hypothetical protein